MRKRRRNMLGCILCGRACTVEAVDNFGNKYKGCSVCRLKSLAEIEAMSATPRDTPIRPPPVSRH